MQQKVGAISDRVAAALGLAVGDDTPIYLGDSNIQHMIQRHPADYQKYGSQIPTILADPDYVGMNPSDGSIEYVKEFLIEGEYVKVAVRIAGTGKYYARSLYVLNPNRVRNFIAKGTLIKP